MQSCTYKFRCTIEETDVAFTRPYFRVNQPRFCRMSKYRRPTIASPLDDCHICKHCQYCLTSSILGHRLSKNRIVQSAHHASHSCFLGITQSASLSKYVGRSSNCCHTSFQPWPEADTYCIISIVHLKCTCDLYIGYPNLLLHVCIRFIR